MRKGIFFKIFILLILSMSFVGCNFPKVIETQEFQDKATIVSTNYSSYWMEPIIVGDITTFINHEEENEVIIEYMGKRYTIDDRDFYNLCQNNDGKSVWMNIRKTTYDNGTIRHLLSPIRN